MKKIWLIFALICLTFLPVDFSFAQTATLEATMSLKTIDGITLPFQNGMPVPSFEKQSRMTVNLAGKWKKQRFTPSVYNTLSKRDQAGLTNIVNEARNRFKRDYPDSAWEDKNLPSVENKMNPYPNVPENYEKGVWYRYRFTAGDSLAGKFVKLVFHSVNYVADVWLNDSYLGYHEGGYTPFAFDVSSKLLIGEENVLAVRVDNPAWGTRNDIVPFYTVDWFNYTGIIGDVYLEAANPASIVRADVVPLDTLGSIQATVSVYNKDIKDKNLTLEASVFNADVNDSNIQTELAKDLLGAPAGASGSTELLVPKDSLKAWRTTLNIPKPRLWSPKEPNLYVLKVTLKDNGNVIDEFYTQFGIRTIKAEGSKLTLNGKPVFFTGVARHEDHPQYGRSMPKSIIYSDIQQVKSINANMLRTAHYPNNLYTYLISDRLGISIIEEIPVWWFDTPTDWYNQNNLRHIHEQMFREMVFKDFNRPSIILWSTSNECKDVNGRILFEARIKQEKNSLYPDGRLITESAAADRPGPNDPSQGQCDVAGWTMYFGIFHGSTYYDGTLNFLSSAKASFPGKPLLDTEFGYWSGETNTSTNTQINVFNDTFRAFKEHAALKSDGSINPDGALAGVTWWCIFDWYTCQQISRNGFQSMGLYKMDRVTAKPVAVWLKSAYAPYFKMGGVATGVEEGSNAKDVVHDYFLEQNYPNPFNPETVIKYRIPEAARVRLTLFDALGRKVAQLLDEEKAPGSYSIRLRPGGFGLSTGVYFYQIKTDKFTKTCKMLFLK
ncbi:MAG TPA: glycoside hydrolase family 2 TIM barrel-domain containing protein [Ignavibacteriales bacterium]|nr:glycoside hydrolase family 2 TIM barrel-domain containing protein [Ignavibacteriales bacterium]